MLVRTSGRFQIEGDDDLEGVGHVPSWLSASNAAAVAGSPCILGLQLDRACRYCKPTPKPERHAPNSTEAEAGGAQSQNTGEGAQETAAN